MKNNIIIGIVCLIIGAIGAKFLFPTVKEKIVEVEKEVIKKDVVTEVREVTRPDGSKETVTVIIDKSQEKREASKIIAIAKSEWHVSVVAVTKDIKTIDYNLQIERRIIGNFHLALGANTNGSYSAGIGYEF